MDELRIRVELNRGGHGVALDTLVEVAREAVRFLQAFARDAGFEGASSQWVAENFANGSVDFDCRLARRVPPPVLGWSRRALRAILANDYRDPEINVRIRPETRRHFSHLAQPLAAGEAVFLGVYGDGGALPDAWFRVDHDSMTTADALLGEARETYGEIQGIVHAFFKETDPPYLKVRELSTQHLVNCRFRPDMYHAAVEVLAEPDAVVFVEGRCREDPDTGRVTDIDVTDFRLAPAFSDGLYRQGLGQFPDYTGDLSSADFVAEGRDG